MAGGAIVGALKYLVEVDSERAALEVDKFLAEAQAKVEAAGGDATFRLLAESAELDKKLADADREIDRLKAKRAEVKIGADTSELDRAIVEAEGELKAMSRERAEITFKTKGAVQALAEMKAIQAIQQDLSKSSSQATDDIDKQNLAVARLRETYNRLASERKRLENIRPAARRTEGERLTLERLAAQMHSMEVEGRRLGAGLENITKDVEGTDGRFRNFAGTLARTRFSIGPLTTTLGGLAKILPVLSPLLIGLVGGASALAGSVGAGLVGAFGVASGAAAGFGLALAPLLPSLKSLFAEAKTAPSVGGALAKMRDSLTGGIRTDFFKGAHQAVTTLQADFPRFKSEAVNAFHAVSEGFQGWMRGLRTPEAQNIIGNLIGNFTKDIGPVMSGLGSLATAFGRFISLASNAGPGISKTFQGWAQGIADSTAKGSGFSNKVAQLVSQAKSLGNALTATGRLTVAFFGAGAKSGQDLLDSLTRSENRWTDWMHSVEGQQSLQTFFRDAVANTKGFFSALAPLLGTFVHLGNALAPVTTGALDVAKALGDVIHTIAEFVPARVTLKAFGGVLVAAFAISKFQALGAALKSVGVFFGLMAAEESGATAATAANTAAIEANTAAMVERAAVGGAAMEATAAETTAMTGAMVEGEAATGLLAGGLSSVLLPAAVLAGGLVYLAVVTDRNHGRMNTFNGTLKRFDQAASGAASSSQKAAQAAQDHAKATKGANNALEQANKLSKDGKTNTDAYNKATNNLVTQQNKQHQAAVQQNQAEKQHNQEINTATSTVDKLQKQYQSLAAQIEKGGRSLKGLGQGARAGVNPQDLRNLQSMSRALNLAKINLDRLKLNRPILPPNALDGINKLRSIAGQKIALHFATTGTPAAIADLSRLASKANQLGNTKRVVKILASSGSANEAVQRLTNYIQHLPTRHNTNLSVNNSQATSAVQQLQADVDALHGKTITNYVNNVIRHGANTGAFMGGIMPGFAAGGSYDAMMEAAYKAAAHRSGLNPAAGALVTQPRYIVGEEPGRTEYIITDNPAYRKSNLGYLRDAAAALGATLVPGYKKGKGNKKKGHGGGGGADNSPGPDSLDDKTGPGSTYDLQEKKVTLDAALADLAKRRYDDNLQGGSLQGFINALSTESSDYSALASTIYGLVHSGLTQAVNLTPPGPEPTKRKKETKAAFQARHDVWARANARYEAQQAHNQATSGQFDLQAEYDTITQSILPGLTLDILEAQNAASTNTILGQESSNSLRQQVFSQFASNVIGGFTGPSLGPGGLGSFTSSPAVTQIGAPTAPGPSFASRSAVGGGGDVNLTNNFAAPPPDPHTWTQTVGFELQAAGA